MMRVDSNLFFCKNSCALPGLSCVSSFFSRLKKVVDATLNCIKAIFCCKYSLNEKRSYTNSSSSELTSSEIAINQLGDTFFEKGRKAIKSAKYLSFQQATTGKIPVYLSKKRRIAIKECGSPENRRRVKKNAQAKIICKKNNYTHLLIPKSRPYSKFVIEKMLVLPPDDAKYQIKLYLKHKEKFTDVAKEFIGFLCQSNYPRTAGRRNEYLEPLGITEPVARYDNIVLCLKKGKGCLGFVDLQRFTPLKKTTKKFNSYIACRRAIYFFPHHFEQILNEAKKFDPNIEKSRCRLKEHKKIALKNMKKIVKSDLDFLKKPSNRS